MGYVGKKSKKKNGSEWQPVNLLSGAEPEGRPGRQMTPLAPDWATKVPLPND